MHACVVPEPVPDYLYLALAGIAVALAGFAVRFVLNSVLISVSLSATGFGLTAWAIIWQHRVFRKVRRERNGH